MRYLYIGFSILCFALSGVITFKALNLPEKNPLNLEALSQVKSHKSSLVVKEIFTEPAIEKAPSNLPVETLQNTNSQPDQKLENESAVSQMDIQTLEATVKQLEQKLSEKIARSQTATQTAENTIAEQEYKPAPLKNVSQSKLNISEPENTEKSMVLLLGDVRFSSGQIVINDNMKKFIEQSAQLILTFLPNCRVVLEGHTDSIPLSETWKNQKDNMDISFIRAKAVARVLEEEGISFKRISVIGYGDTRPIASNGTVEGRAKNRRVVVKLILYEKEI